MNIANLAEVIRDVKPDLTSLECSQLAAALLKRMSHILLSRGQLRLRGIGKLVVVKRPPRRGRNPATGQALQIPERRQVRFTVGVALHRELQLHKWPKAVGAAGRARSGRSASRSARSGAVANDATMAITG